MIISFFTFIHVLLLSAATPKILFVDPTQHSHYSRKINILYFLNVEHVIINSDSLSRS